jgi:hypothetical protein
MTAFVNFTASEVLFVVFVMFSCSLSRSNFQNLGLVLDFFFGCTILLYSLPCV